MLHSLRQADGYLGIVTVLIISVVTLAAAVGVTLLGSNELFFSYQSDLSEEGMELADACAEEAYYRLKRDSSYSGGTVNTPENDCTVSISGSGSTRTITVTATLENTTRTLTADVTLQSNNAGNADGIDLTGWEE